MISRGAVSVGSRGGLRADCARRPSPGENSTAPPETHDEDNPQLQQDIGRLKRRLDEIVAIDFFGARGREAATGLVTGIEARLPSSKATPRSSQDEKSLPENLIGKTRVTRKGIHVDRMASAWLVRRFIDPTAGFKFVPAKGYKPLPNEIRFDMFEAEFTHEPDCCTMEVLMGRLALRDPALALIAEIVHDIDLKDSKFERPETPGLERLIAGVAMARKDDETRLSRGTQIFDDLYEYFSRKRN